MHEFESSPILAAYGFDALFAERFQPYGEQGLLPGRVIVEYQHIYRVVTDEGELLARVAGRLRHRANGRLDYPAVGDWVALKVTPGLPGEERATVHAVLERNSRFARKVAGSVVAEQVVAANVDVVLLVMALVDTDFSPRRLERYLVLAYESGARPVLVLTKADLTDDLAGQLETVRGVVGPDVPIHVVSQPRDEGYDALLAYLRPGKTVALLGSSGVGKSTIVNRLVGFDLLRTQDVRITDSRGRHTSTARQMVLLDGGGVLIDTPGMRELQLWDPGQALGDAFTDIDELSGGCRFRDCRHVQEPGCAVIAAAAGGALPPDRLESFQKLAAEREQQEKQLDARSMIEEKRRAKAQGKALNKHLKDKRG